MQDRTGQVAVIFTNQRRGTAADGYAAAAAAMDALAAAQPGYLGIDSARGTDGFGITISWWADEAAAVAWRRNAEHAAVRQQGRENWYETYAVAVGRAYDWRRG
jgi:heme-degrading monooxygenase HmoA